MEYLQTKYNYRKVLLVSSHLLAWGIFIFYPMILLNIRFHNDIFLFKLLINGVFLAGVFYFNMYFLIPVYYAQNKYFHYFGLALLLLVFILFEEVLVNYLLSRYIELNPTVFENGNIILPPEIERAMGRLAEKPPLFRPELPINAAAQPGNRMLNPGIVSRTLSSGIIVLALSGFMRISKEWMNLDHQRKELEKSKLDAELSLLKLQLNPHFLFNSLNSIYSLSRKKSEVTEKAILKLSQLMRYMIYEAGDEMVSLIDEIHYLNNYVELQKLRLSEKVKVVFDISIDNKDHKIAPMLFIVFVENAFKHGVSYVNNSHIYMDLQVTGNKIEFKVVNNFSEQNNDSQFNGVGIENLRKRLSLIYPDKHSVNIEANHNIFTAYLSIEV